MEEKNTQGSENKMTFGTWTLAAISAAAFVVIFITANVALDAYVLVKLWSWLIVPAFAVPYISKKAAVGISLIVALTSHQVRSEDAPMTKVMEFTFGVPLLLLLTGWVVARL